MIDGQQFAVVAALGRDPQLLPVIVGDLLPVEVILVEEDAFDQPLLINSNRPAVKFTQYKVGHDPAAQRGEDQRPALQQVLLPRPEDDGPVLQHHDALAVLLVVPHEAVVEELVSFEHLQRGSHVFLGDLLLGPVLLGVFGLESGF